jgi:protocatechuate 3,4-dioxygenase beta subunit
VVGRHDAPMPKPDLLQRRNALKLLGGVGAAAFLAACGDDAGTTAASSTPEATTATTAASSGDITALPDETGGPYPADGTNGPNVLTDGAVVREDIRASFGEYAGTADGVPMDIELTIYTAATDAAKAGAAVYLWHCTRDGAYSIYQEDENYLRGVGEADANGVVRFTSIFPGCYSGRWPHIHFEIFEDVDAALGGANPIKTTQLALPEETCATVYATDGYEASSGNLARTSLDSDNVFRDGYANQVATATGDPDSGYTIRLNVGV